MSKVKRLLIALASSTLFALLFACATAPPPVKVQVENALVAKQGDQVQLFTGGSKSAKEEFCLNAEVPVYRYAGKNSSLGSTPVDRKEVGKIKVTKDLGDYYIEAVVLEGSVRSGDIAVQAQSGCLVAVPGQ